MEGIKITIEHLDGVGGESGNESLGFLLNKLRIAANKYQWEVAEDVSGGKQYRISEIETDFKTPKLKTLISFANAVGYDLCLIKREKDKKLRGRKKETDGD